MNHGAAFNNLNGQTPTRTRLAGVQFVAADMPEANEMVVHNYLWVALSTAP
jgi:hypothetical protein